jgi:hypothetical protein
VGKRSTKAVVRQRVEEVYALRLGGIELHQLRDHAAAQGWNVSDSQLKKYIGAADELMKERVEKRADVLLARHLLQRRTLFARAVEAGDHRTALAVLDSEAKLERLEPPKLIAPTNPEGTAPYAPALSDGDRAAAVAALLAAARGAPTGEQT